MLNFLKNISFQLETAFSTPQQIKNKYSILLGETNKYISAFEFKLNIYKDLIKLANGDNLLKAELLNKFKTPKDKPIQKNSDKTKLIVYLQHDGYATIDLKLNEKSFDEIFQSFCKANEKVEVTDEQYEDLKLKCAEFKANLESVLGATNKKIEKYTNRRDEYTIKTGGCGESSSIAHVMIALMVVFVIVLIVMLMAGNAGRPSNGRCHQPNADYRQLTSAEPGLVNN